MRGAFRQQFGGLPRSFWVMWFAQLLYKIGDFVTIVLALYLTQERHLPPATVGLVLGLLGGGAAIGSVVGGHLADIWGRRSTLLVARISTAVAVLGMAFATSVPAIAASAAFIGLFYNMARPAFVATLIDVVGPADRMRALTLNYWVINVGFTLAAVVGGLLASFDFFLVFAINAAITLASGLIVYFLVPETRPEHHAKAEVDDSPTNPYRDRTYLGLLLSIFLVAVVFSQNSSTLPIAMADAGLSADVYGGIIAINGVLIVAGQLFLTRLTGRFNHSVVLAAAAVITGLGFAITGFATTALVFAISVSVWTIGEMLEMPPKATLTAELSPLHGRGRYQGAMSVAYSLAGFVAPILGGAIYQFNPMVLWIGCLGLGLVAAALNLASRTSRNARVAALAQT